MHFLNLQLLFQYVDWSVMKKIMTRLIMTPTKKLKQYHVMAVNTVNTTNSVHIVETLNHFSFPMIIVLQLMSTTEWKYVTFI